MKQKEVQPRIICSFVSLVLILYTTPISGETRCYCNEPACVTTGYMCRTISGRCYTKISTDGAPYRSTHGCTDSLPSEPRNTGQKSSVLTCQEVGTMVMADGGPDAMPHHLWQCCQKDMCNYMDSNAIEVFVNNWNKSEEARGNSHKDSSLTKQNPVKSLEKDINQELWFKAAVIAVPIAGGFILVLLVLLAMRMLKHDTRQQDKLKLTKHIDTHQQKTKSYINHHFSSETKKHIARKQHQPIQSLSEVEGQDFADVHQAKRQSIVGENIRHLTKTSSNSAYKDISIHIDCDTKKEHRNSRQLPPRDARSSEDVESQGAQSIVLWGKPNQKNVSEV